LNISRELDTVSKPTITAAQAALAQVRAQRATQQYRQGQAFSVTPGHLIVMLYDGVLRFLSKAKLAIEEQQVEVAHSSICRVQDIILELDRALDTTNDVATNLHDIYMYCYHRLVEANMQKNVQILAEISGHFELIRDAWRNAVTQVDTSGMPGNVGNVQIAFPGTQEATP
jgi:flagellar protein FliS